MSRISNIIINIIAITLVSYLLVEGFYNIIGWPLNEFNIDRIATGSEPDRERLKSKPLKDFQAITDRNIFGSMEKLPEKEPQKPVETLEPTTLNITLLGTVFGDIENRMAVIEEKGKRKQALYRVGDSVQNGVIKSILRGKIVLRVGDRDEVLMMPEPSSSPAPAVIPDRPIRPFRPPEPLSLDRTITIRRQDIESSLEEGDELLAQVRITPHLKDNVPDGVVITGISAGSIFRRMGLRNGDIINTINNESISSDEDLLSLYNELNTGSEISIQIERRGIQRTLNYNIR